MHQAVRALNQKKNLDQMTQARAILIQIQMNSDPKKADQLPTLVDFLPYPAEWIRQTQDLKIKVSRKTALDILSEYETLDASIRFALEPILKDLEICSQIY